MNFSLALETLRNATDEEIQNQLSDTIQTLKALGERLQVGFILTTPYTVDTNTPPPSDPGTQSPSSTADTTADEPTTYEFTADALPASSVESTRTVARHTSDVLNVLAQPTANSTRTQKARHQRHRTKRTLVERLVGAMQGHISWIRDIIFTGDDIISCKRGLSEDARLEDYRRVEGNGTPNNQTKLLRLLSIRSLATDFVQEPRGEDKLQTLTEFVLSTRHGKLDSKECNSSRFKGRCRQISEFVALHPTLSSAPDANRAINKGIKHLLFERVLKKRLDELQLPDTCEAVSAILGLSVEDFKTLTLAQIPQLVDALISNDASIYLPTEDGTQEDKLHVLDFVRDIHTWFAGLQSRYNNIRMGDSTPEPEWPIAKRPCHDDQTACPKLLSYPSRYQQRAGILGSPPEESQITTPVLLEPGIEHQISELGVNLFEFTNQSFLESEYPRSEANTSLEDESAAGVDHSFDYTFQAAPYGTQQLFADIETQPVDFAVPCNPLFTELAPCLSAQMFNSSLPPLYLT